MASQSPGLKVRLLFLVILISLYMSGGPGMVFIDVIRLYLPDPE